MSVAAPRVAVVVASRNRPERLRACVESVLASDHDAFELIVVEQTAEATTLPPDPRLRHIHSATVGKSAALNVGLSHTSAAVIAFTDDDCTVPPEWISMGEALFDAHPEVSMAFGTLVAVGHDPEATFVPSAEFPRFRVVRGSRSAIVRGGAGADMFARRELFEVIGGYDELIGPGARFQACEEYDIYFRTLAAGRAVAFDPELAVVHLGARSYADGEGQMLKRWYAYGEGAVIAKHLKLHDGMVVPAARIMGDDVWEILKSLRRHRLTGIGQLAYKWKGLLSGLAVHVDRATRVYRTDTPADLGSAPA